MVKIINLAVWLLAATVVLFGFYVGDTADSQAAVDERFAEERAVAADGMGVVSTGLSWAEDIAHWGHRHDGTFVGDGLEAVALVAIAIPPARAGLEVMSA